MKKLTLNVCLFFSTFIAHSQGLENIIVEKYYVSDAADSLANDAISANPGTLPVGSVTYRVYVDMAAGYKLQAVYGTPANVGSGSLGHELRIATTTSFFNNEDRGAISPNGITIPQTKSNTVMLDSWLSLGATASGKVGVLKTDDTDGSIGNSDGVLANADASAGIPVSTQDGMIAGTPAVFNPLLGPPDADAELEIFNAGGTVGNSLVLTNGSWSSPAGVSGPNAANRVLIAQLTTKGTLSFELNLQLITPDNKTEKYVAKSPEGVEIVFDACTYPVIVNSAPTVSITVPASNAMFKVGDTVAITASAADPDGTISSVEFLIDGVSNGMDATAPYSYNWKTSSYTKGTKNITAVATDDKGKKTTSAAVTISVLDSGNVAPVVSITSPAGGASFNTGDSFTITADATDDDSVRYVEFYANDGQTNELIGTGGTTPPYQYTWTVSVAGTYTLTAVAADHDAAVTTSSGVLITVVDTTNVAPVVSITAPADNTSVNAGDTVLITANATDDGTIALVEFFADGSKIGEDAVSPYEYQWTSVAGTAICLTAVATDNDGAKTTSACVTISVQGTDGIRDINSSGILFSVYPNPAKNVLTMAITVSKPGYTNRYAIYDIRGNLVLYKEIGKISEKYEETIDVSMLTNGQYMIELLIDGVHASRQIIKN